MVSGELPQKRTHTCRCQVLVPLVFRHSHRLLLVLFSPMPPACTVRRITRPLRSFPRNRAWRAVSRLACTISHQEALPEEQDRGARGVAVAQGGGWATRSASLACREEKRHHAATAAAAAALASSVLNGEVSCMHPAGLDCVLVFVLKQCL